MSFLGMSFSKAKPMRKLSQLVQLTGVERTFPETDIIVSKTDLKGRITYANDVFLRIANMTLEETLGMPHSVIRHPDMPRAVFKFLWDSLLDGHEVFAYVLNLAADGSHYWVFAHVTPTYGSDGEICGFHSSRRMPNRAAVNIIIPIYQQLRDIENSHTNSKVGLEKSFQALCDYVASTGMSYDELVFSITH